MSKVFTSVREAAIPFCDFAFKSPGRADQGFREDEADRP